MIKDICVPIKQGITLHYLHTDNFKTAVFSINFLFRQQKGTAAADTILPRMLLHGCDLYPTQRDLLIRLEELYGAEFSHESGQNGEMRLTHFGVDFLSGQYLPSGETILDSVVGLLFRLIFHPLLDGDGHFMADDLEREKESHLQALLSIRDQKMTYAIQSCRKLMAEKKDYDVPPYGTVEETESITPALMAEQYRRMIGESDIQLYYVGGDPLEDVKAAVSLGTAELSPREAVKGIQHGWRRHAAKVRCETELTQGEQGILVLGFRTGVFFTDPDAYISVLFSEILSNSPMAKLFREVREKRNLCYSVAATCSPVSGIMMIYAGIDRKDKKKAKAAIRRVLRQCKNGEISDEEMNCAKESVRNAYLSILDSTETIEAFYSQSQIKGIPGTLEERMEKALSATVSDIASLASKLTLDTVYFLDPGEEGAVQ